MAFGNVFEGFALEEDDSYTSGKTGWVLTPELVACPYIKCRDTAAKNLCAEFRYMVETPQGLELSKGVSPNVVALSEVELRDMTADSRATFMGFGSLRQAAFDKFAPLSNPVPAPSHVLLPVETAKVITLHTRPAPTQMAAQIPADQQSFRMEG